MYRARHVIVATGLNREPHMPEVDGAAQFAAQRSLCHSWEVESCAPYRDKRVLVVGSGNSAAEVATSLHREGAACVVMLVDTPRHFVRRSTLGRIFALFPYCGLDSDSLVHDMHRATFGDDAFDAKPWRAFQVRGGGRGGGWERVLLRVG